MKASPFEFGTLFHYSPIPNWVYDVDSFEILEVNQAAIEAYGYSHQEFLGLSLLDLSPAEEIAALKFKHEDAKEQQRIIHFGIFTHRKKSGAVFKADIYGHKLPVKDRNAIMVSCLNITEKQDKLTELQASEKKLKAATAIARIGYWRLDLATGALSWSDEVYEIWGRDKSSFLLNRENFLSTFHPDDLEEFRKEEETAFSNFDSLSFTHRILLPDNSIKWIHEQGRFEMNEAGQRIALEGTVQDITLQKTEEQRLKLLERVITHTNDTVIITETGGKNGPAHKIVYVNDSFTRMTGYHPEEVIGKSPILLQGPKTDQQELAKLSSAIEKGESCEITTINYTKEGEPYWVHFSVSPVTGDNGRITHWIAIERDITQQKQTDLAREMLGKISSLFSESVELNKSLQLVCKEVAEFNGFSFVEIWLPALRKDKLKRQATSYVDEAGKLFFEQTAGITEFRFDEGMPGRVWQLQKKQVLDVQEFHWQIPRWKVASDLGIQTMTGIPLFNNGQLIGVLTTGSVYGVKDIELQSTTLSKLEAAIGAEIHRKRIETELTHLFQSLPDLICLGDFEGRFLKVNAAGCRILEFEEHELIGSNFKQFMHPEDRDIGVQELTHLQNGESVYQLENRFITKSGQIKWLSWNCNASPSEGVIFATAKDITEEKKLAELLDTANSLARIGGWELDVNTQSLFWSDLLHELHGTDPATYIPNLKDGIRFYKEEFREPVQRQLQHSIDTGEPLDLEAVIVSTRDEELWVRVIGKAEMVDGECVRMSGSFQDINDRKQTEQILRSLTDDLPGVSFQYIRHPNGSDEFRSVSKGSLKIWALEPEECTRDIKQVWRQIMMGGDYGSVIESIEHSVHTGIQWHNRWRNILPNGKVRWHEGFGTPYKLPDGSVLFNSMIFDITEEEKATLLYEETSELAKIGSWELNLKDQTTDNMYWSPVVKNILEVDEDYNPSLSGGMEFYEGESRQRIEYAVKELMEDQVPFDEELLIRTATGKLKWVRCIGKGEFINGECTRIFGSYQDIHELKKAYEERTNILESIGDAFFTMDKNFTVNYWNRAAEELIGVKREQLLQKNLLEVFPDAIQLPSYTNYLKAMETGEPIRFEDYFGRWLEVHAYPNEEGLSVFFRDISLRKEADLRLQKAYEERNTILESIGDAFFALDKEWIVTYWNKEAAQLLGKTKEEILGKNLWIEYDDVIDSDFYRMYHKAAETGESQSFEEYYPTIEKWFDVTAYPSEAGLSVYFKDITLRKETDIRIREANERFEKVAEATNEAIWDWNIRENTLFWGTGFHTIFGYDVQKVSPTLDSWIRHIPDPWKQEVVGSFEAVMHDPGKSQWEMEYQFLKADNSLAIVVDRAIIIRDRFGKAIRAVGALQDISYRKKMESELQLVNIELKEKIRELEMANEELEQFAFIASHDLQEPLRMISSFMDQLKRKYGPQLDAKAHQYIHFAADGARRMKRIILDLLEYSRAGRLEGEKEELDLEELITDYLYLRKKIYEEKSAVLYRDALPVIKAYRAPLIQTLHSLLDNAVKYSKPDLPPVIRLSVEEQPEEWVFSIKDNGIGIDKQYFEKIFVIFQRLHNRDQFDGTGIGLSIVKKNIESWGGRIWIESAPGKGSTFHFTIIK